MQTSPESRDQLARYTPALIAAVAVVVAVPLGLARGAASAVLWLAFATLASAVLLFWETLRTLVDPTVPVADEEDEDLRLAAIEARKTAALRALKDIAFERSIGRLGDDDYKQLEVRYRAEAREAMASIDAGVGPWRARAESLLDEAESRAKGGDAPVPEAPAAEAPAAPAKVTCAKCDASNDDDATFCKKCGARVREEAPDATA